MKKLLVVLLVSFLTVGCKTEKSEGVTETPSSSEVTTENDKTEKQNDGLIAIQGNYLYVAQDNAAVLQTSSEMYGIVINDKIKELNAQVDPLKNEPYDMITITVRGKIFKNEGAKDEWENKIEIEEILKVSRPETEDNDVIKLGTK
ncbi:hypothetical protein [Psychroserpens sp.]|uniref:hypothetical protein n=1 Tax=Psychroserpens sp. TaxID=2020870 RepID=UPI001B079208|nr:hypothetical protein [Psychroserpens sp.]MBO6605217.1 hypothetical protein [Psychroserpens sp.]MBO6630149.1 hypothetical protein [Psychroserpens sp.]MBO6653974.1 hypothetical protein [Psychroserpens sp.]MBO6682295.1 hypothetical protein [Psychroserpens sp.]MBO6748591.1 hypothetical protein [Psychroserpens sp.]